MDNHRDRTADGKRPSRRSGGGSKKSTRSSSREVAGVVAGTGGEGARGYSDPRNSAEGFSVRPDGLPAGAPAKDSLAEAGAHRSKKGAKGIRRGSDRVDAGGVEAAPGKGQQHVPADSRADGASWNANQAILEKWKTEASIAAVKGETPEPVEPQTPPEEVIEEDNGYDYEGFEEYSDEFDGDDDEGPSSTPPRAVAASSTVRGGRDSRNGGGGGGFGSAGGARPTSSRVVSPSLKVRESEDIQTPDDKALQELRHSLREENDVARERKIARPTMEATSAADAKPAIRAVTGAKGSKGSRTIAPGRGPGRGDGAVAIGKISMDASADAKDSTSRKRSTSSFKMADAKALTRALAKGDPRAARILAIRSTSRLEVESIRLFDQSPVAPIDLYHRRLRGQPATIRQVASQTNEDARSVEAQTDEILLADKEVQFHLGHDDTALENLMRRVRSARRPSHQQERGGEGKEKGEANSSGNEVLRLDSDGDDGSSTIYKGVYRAEYNGESAANHGAGESAGSGEGGLAFSAAGANSAPPPQRLGKFLRHACLVMETLCEENLLISAVDGASGSGSGRLEAEDDDSANGQYSLFPDESEQKGWEELGLNAQIADVFGSSGGDNAHDMARATERDEENAEVHTRRLASPRGLGCLLDGADVVGVTFSRTKRSMLVTAHARPSCQGFSVCPSTGAGNGDKRGASLDGCGVVCVWNAENATSAPVGVLFGEGLFSCLALALHQPHIILVGTTEGCLLLWDMREPASASRAQARELGLECGLRPPTYTTAGGGGAGLTDAGYGHASAVVSVVPIPIPEGGVDGGGIGEMVSLGEANSFQVASLDDRGTVSIWVVNETPTGDEGGSQTDLGLCPGGRVRLTLAKSLRPGMETSGSPDVLRSHTTAPSMPAMTKTGKARTGPSPEFTPAAACALEFSPGDPNRFLVAASTDRIAHASRLGEAPPPKAYRSLRPRAWGKVGAASGHGQELGSGGKGGDNGVDDGAMGGVTCLSFSPFFRSYFLAGCGNGSVRLYKDNCAAPLTVWEGFCTRATPPVAASDTYDWPLGVSSVAWSEHRPAVFFVLDTGGTLHGFDVLEDDTGPVASESCPGAAALAAKTINGRKGEGNGSRDLSRGRYSTGPGEEKGAQELRATNVDGASGTIVRTTWPLRLLSPPILALSSETLATGSRPRVAVSVGERAFTRGLSRRMFRTPSVSRSAPGERGEDRVRRGKGRSDGGGVAREIERMWEWFGAVLSV